MYSFTHLYSVLKDVDSLTLLLVERCLIKRYFLLDFRSYQVSPNYSTYLEVTVKECCNSLAISFCFVKLSL